MGHRECDECSGPVFPDQFGLDPEGRDLCGYCLPEDVLPAVPDWVQKLISS
jgi:hypothetical protein